MAARRLFQSFEACIGERSITSVGAIGSGVFIEAGSESIIGIVKTWSDVVFTVRRLIPGDAELIERLQLVVQSALPDPTVFQLSTREFISYCLGGGGVCYAAFVDKTAVAYRIVYYPHGREFNLGRDLALPKEKLEKVAHWDTLAVLPGWRGQHLSAQLNSRALADIAVTEYRHLLSTSSPNNPYGVRALMNAGFRPVRLVFKFGGRVRLLFYRPNPDAWGMEEKPEDQKRVVALSDLQALTESFEEGWHGTEIRLTPSPVLVLQRLGEQDLQRVGINLTA